MSGPFYSLPPSGFGFERATVKGLSVSYWHLTMTMGNLPRFQRSYLHARLHVLSSRRVPDNGLNNSCPDDPIMDGVLITTPAIQLQVPAAKGGRSPKRGAASASPGP